MEQVEILQGVPGMLRPFKAYLKEKEIGIEDQVVFYGCPGTCTPFVELLSWAVRDLGIVPVFVPFIDETKAQILTAVDGVGMQATNKPNALKPKLIVVMGGLSMPNVPLEAPDVLAVTKKYDVPVIGICFMDMFKKTGWLDTFSFDLLIDAAIDPVTIWKA